MAPGCLLWPQSENSGSVYCSLNSDPAGGQYRRIQQHRVDAHTHTQSEPVSNPLMRSVLPSGGRKDEQLDSYQPSHDLYQQPLQPEPPTTSSASNQQSPPPPAESGREQQSEPPPTASTTNLQLHLYLQTLTATYSFLKLLPAAFTSDMQILADRCLLQQSALQHPVTICDSWVNNSTAPPQPPLVAIYR